MNEYLSRLKSNTNPLDDFEVLTPALRLSESLLFGLRMSEGINLKELEQQSGCLLEKEKMGKIEEFVKQGLLNLRGAHLKATGEGRLVLDELAAYLI